jgi:branched-chain amino acid transport system substrate-binding protein
MRRIKTVTAARWAAVLGVVAAGVAVALPATSATAASGTSVTFYSSLPMQGATSTQTGPVVKGIQLALKQAGYKAGPFKITYKELDDSTAQAGQWDPSTTGANARRAASDSSAVFYIGEFNSGASQVSIPILNEGGLAQLSPANTYAGLTVSLPPATAPGEPQKFYPTGKRTYFRLVPIDTIQGASDLLALKQAGCKKLAIANDGQAYGAGLAKVLGLESHSYGIKVVYNKQIDTTAANFNSVAQAIASSGAQCFEFSGTTATAGTAVAKAVYAALPHAKVIGPDGVCSTSWTTGMSTAELKNMLCTVAALDLKAQPGGESFLRAYKKAYGVANPDPYAIYGYAAAQVGLEALAKVKPGGNLRAKMVAELHSMKSFETDLGTFSFNAAGDTSLVAYGLYKFNSKGVEVFWKTMRPKYYIKVKS